MLCNDYVDLIAKIYGYYYLESDKKVNVVELHVVIEDNLGLKYENIREDSSY